MNKLESYSRGLTWCTVLLLSALAAGCGGGGEGRDPILGAGGTLIPPTTIPVIPPPVTPVIPPPVTPVIPPPVIVIPPPVIPVIPPPPPASILGSASRFGIFGGSAGTTNTGIQTVITGSSGNTADIGTTATGTSSITGFHDSPPSDVYTEVEGANVGNVTGKIYTCTNSTTGPTSALNYPAGQNPVSCEIATNARADALAAYNTLVARPGGPDPGAGNLANLVLAPGVYTAASGSFRIQGGNLTLDAQGDANAVWVFQMATSLTVGGPGAAFPQSVTLVNGALPKNVYWQVGSAATINAAGGGTMVGTIISQAGAAFSTAGNVTQVTLNGRALSLNASVTMVDTVINVPAP